MFVCVQVSEQQLNEAIAQAVENSKLKRDKSHWSMEGKYDSEWLSIGCDYRHFGIKCFIASRLKKLSPSNEIRSTVNQFGYIICSAALKKLVSVI